MKKLFIAALSALAFIFFPYTQAIHGSPLAYPVERLAGQDRVETALSISQKGWSTAQTVFLCEFSDYPDSIASTPFAVSLNAPILLTDGVVLDPRVIQELERLKPQKVILLGGTGRLKTSIESKLKDVLKLDYQRIGGADRYETSILLAKNLKSDSLILANGDDFPDALSAATFAGIQQIPIVLTSKEFPSSVVQYINEVKPQHLYVVGGEGVIPTEELNRYNLKAEARLGGQDRYETNAAVISSMKSAYKTDNLFLASGITFPDAVAGTVLAAKYKAPLLLTEKEDVPPAVYTIMRTNMKIEPPRNSTPSPTPTSPSETTYISPMRGRINASGSLNLRETPSSNAKVLLAIPEGASIDLLDQQEQWYKTTFQSKTGWVSSTYINVLSPQKGTVSANGGLNLRDSASWTAKTLLTVPKGAKIDLLAKQDQWYKTTYQGKTGWIAAQYIELDIAKIGTIQATTSKAIDLSVNGTVYILGGTGVISPKTQLIIEGTVDSSYPENRKAFPPLPSQLNKPDPPEPVTPIQPVYDPSVDVLIDPFLKLPVNALAGKTIVVDPGHGGPDTGAIGPTASLEKNNNLAIAMALNDYLKKAGATVYMTRSKDVSPAASYSQLSDLEARVAFANGKKADLFISIHNDWFSNPLTQGSAVYYSDSNPKNQESLQLASCLRTALVDTVKTTDRGVKPSNFYVLRNTTMPAILLETAFISNLYEEARLQNPVFRTNVAGGILIGIYQYFKTPLPQD